MARVAHASERDVGFENHVGFVLKEAKARSGPLGLEGKWVGRVGQSGKWVVYYCVYMYNML